MPISWNEIKKRAIEFSQEWQDATRENAEAQSFYNDFFNVFGISRRRVASFEEPVKKLGDKRGRIDLFWKGILLAEQKSAGQDLAKAKTQALDYFPNLKEEELPRYVLVSDFQHFELYDLDEGKEVAFPLKNLHKNVEHFGFIAGYQKREFKDQDPVNIDASILMGGLHDQLKDIGYEGEDLELFLVRLLFCLFADDTGIFEKDIFTQYIEERTREDGSDLGGQLAHLFQTLDKPHEKRAKTLDEDLACFPYVNGTLFERQLPIASFNSDMREALLKACYFNWSFISPAIFGSLFQSVMDKQKRRGIGAHYTTEQNIMKVIRPLFLDALHAEFEKVKNSRNKLTEFHKKLAGLRFLDPACGCGNFLIIAYRELRELEILVLKVLYSQDQRVLDVNEMSHIDVDQFHGIEFEEFPARIAEVALWLVDHQMNMKLSEAFGQYYVRIPLRKSAHIVHGNALTLDWKEVVQPSQLSYILGNPPFVGHQYRSESQATDMKLIWGIDGKFRRLDYVTCWYQKAAHYLEHNRKIVAAFVSTNSITQGEQASILWSELFANKVYIHFAHRTFQWASDARGKAAVHCVIIGFALYDILSKALFDYDTPKSAPHLVQAKNINGYLIDALNIALPSRTKPRNGFPQMLKGSQPTDGGYLILSDLEKEQLIRQEPAAADWIKQYIGGEELLSGKTRWCLWLKGISPTELKEMSKVLERVEGVKTVRLKSSTKSVREFANYPTLFTQDRQPSAEYLALPEVSSESRRYIPIDFLSPDIIASNKIQMIVGATLYHLGILCSEMHMTWVRHISGRLESRYSYSPSVYNNFPWPENPSEKQVKAIEEKAQAVLDARAQFPDSSLADLYDPLTMPPTLLKAHQALDKAVDLTYRPQPFPNERGRIEFLFDLYQRYSAPLILAATKRRKNSQGNKGVKASQIAT